MTIDEFQSALDELGADIAHWPAAMREKAHVLLGNSTEARLCLSRALAIDNAIDQHLGAPVKAPPGLADRILLAAARDGTPPQTAKIIPLRPEPAPVPAPARPWHQVALAYVDRSALVAAAALTCCFAVGMVAAQVQFAGDAENMSLYISNIYAGLAW